MGDAQKLVKVVNGKLIYLVGTSDLMKAKLTQVIHSGRQMYAAFNGWQTRFNKYANDEHCHLNLNQDFWPVSLSK